MPKILVVDDEEIIALSLQVILQSWGYVVPFVASSGAEAIQLNTENSFDLVLMNIQPSYASLPIIAMTANVIDGVKENCLDADMSDYLIKSIDAGQLYAILARWVGPKK